MRNSLWFLIFILPSYFAGSVFAYVSRTQPVDPLFWWLHAATFSGLLLMALLIEAVQQYGLWRRRQYLKDSRL